MATDLFFIDYSLRVPGLGLLVLPTAPAPGWLAAHPLHTALALRLHRPGQAALALLATIEEIAHGDQPIGRALLLDADPGRPLPAGTWLEITAAAADDLLELN